MQERRNSSALAMELRLSCTNPLIFGANKDATISKEHTTEMACLVPINIRLQKRCLVLRIAITEHFIISRTGRKKGKYEALNDRWIITITKQKKIPSYSSNKNPTTQTYW